MHTLTACKPRIALSSYFICSTEGALCTEPSVVSKTVAVISGILPDNSS